MTAPGRRRPPPMRTLAALLVSLLFIPAGAAFAQQAALQITQGPYYTGVPIDLQIVANGFEEEPQPEVSAEAPPGTTLNFVQARPQVSSMMQIINGRVTQSREVRFGFVYQLTASTAGRYTLGPYAVTQNGTSVTTNSRTITIADVPEATGQRLRVVLPDRPTFIGQRVPVTVEWWTERGMADRLYNQRLNVPLFLDTTNFQFLDEERPPSRIVISVDMPGGSADIPSEVRQASGDGKDWVIRSFTRTLVPVATGRFDFGRPALFCEEAVSFQRDIFGSRVPSQTRRIRVSGDPIVIDVQAVPSAGRPASFAGAIGQGFTLDVTADRTVVQAGDPVKLEITIRGDGSLDAASLPPLAAAGLSPKQFRLPDGDVAGISDDAGKHFEVTVRVVDPAVQEIPPIEYSWFDPSAGRFETTRSQPVALSVRAGTTVGAGDVVSAVPAETIPDDKAETAKPGAGTAASRTPAFTLTGADLSIETDPGRLRSGSSSLLGSAAVAWGGYGAGIFAITAGLLVRRRRSIDPVRARLFKDLRALRAHVSSGRNPKSVADALRKMASLETGAKQRPAELDRVLEGLDDIAYAPGGDTAAIPDAVRKQAVAAADAMLEQAR